MDSKQKDFIDKLLFDYDLIEVDKNCDNNIKGALEDATNYQKEYYKPTRLDELYQNAISFYLDKSDIDVTEWMGIEDKEEYRTLYIKENGECPFCGEVETECVKHCNNN